MEEKTTLNIVEEERAKGNIAFMTIDGLKGSSVDNLLNQPIEGILYDLNRDYATLSTLAKNSKNLRWVNDLALSDLFKEVYNRYKKLNEENKLLKEEISALRSQSEKTSNNVKETEQAKNEKQPAQNAQQNKYKEGFDTDIVFVI